MLASTWLDLVIGVDLHFEMVPTPAPVPTPFPHPFVGMVFDLNGLVMATVIDTVLAGGVPPKGPVFINFLPATNTGTDVQNKLVLPHFVIPPGTMWTPMPKAPSPKIGTKQLKPPPLPIAPAGDAVLMMGALTTELGGSNPVRLGDVAMSCGEPVRLPSSMVLATPKGMPVLIGGPPGIDWGEAAGALLRCKWAAGMLHALVSRVRRVRLRNFLHKMVCFLTGHPVDVATGRVLTDAVDWELPGPLPLRFERNYASSWAGRDSPLGYGWSHSLDLAVWEEPGKVVYRAEDGREIEFDTFDLHQHRMREGEELFEPINRLILRCLDARRWEVETADGLVHEFAHGFTGLDVSRVVRTRQRHLAGHDIRYEYDARGRLESVRDSAGRLLRFHHDAHGRLVQVDLPHPNQAGLVPYNRYVYSQEGDLLEAHDALGHARRFEYQGHLMVKETDRTGLTFYFGYDGQGPGAYCIRTWGDGGIYDHEILYDKSNRITMVTNSLGHTTTYHANEVWAVVKVMDPAGGVTRYEYDEALRKTVEVDPLGHATRYEYDRQGNCTKLTRADGSTLTWEYDEFNEPRLARDACEGLWRWSRDDRGCLRAVSNPLGQLEVYQYDARGLLRTLTDPGGARLVLTHDAAGNISSVQMQGNAEVVLSYDRLGRLVSERNETGSEERYFHDAVGRMTRRERHGNDVLEMEYDGEGRLTRAHDRFGTIRYFYTGYHQLFRQEHDGHVVEFAYDTENQLVAVRNENGDVHRLSRDGCGRVVVETGFDGAVRHYTWDGCGNLLKVIEPSGRWSARKHDELGRLVAVHHGDGSWERYAYRQDGLLIEACNENHVVRLKRDLLGRVIDEAQGDMHVTTLYNEKGLSSAMKSSLGMCTSFVCNPLGELATVEIVQGAGPWYFQFQRDAWGKEFSRSLPGGWNIQWERDDAGKPLSQCISKQGEQVLARAWKWSGDHRLTNATDVAGRTWAYQHDTRGRLVGAHCSDGTTHSVAPDAVGNVYRTPERHDRRFGPGGVLLESRGTKFVHDRDGRLVEKILQDGRRWRYAYEGADRLVEVVRPDGERVRMSYDALGRRTRKVMGARVVEYVWAGDMPLHELRNGLLSATWLFEPGAFEPIALVDDTGCHGVVNDQLGVPQAILSDSGDVTWLGHLDIHGQSRIDLERVVCPWRWPGQYSDEETGLSYNRFRYYSPEDDRYISPGPLGLEGGLSSYGYVPDPLVWIDPLGLLFGWYTFQEGDRWYIGSSVDTHRRLGEHIRGERLASRAQAQETAVEVFGAVGRDARRLLRLAEQDAIEEARDYAGKALSNAINAVGERRIDFYRRLRSWYEGGQQGPRPCR